MSKAKNILLEVIQFAPIITLASSFVVSGKIDLERAGTLFLISGGMALAISAIVMALKGKLNPVILGTNLWLLIGAITFGLSIEPLVNLMGRLQATGLFICIFVVGVALTIKSQRGFLGIDDSSSIVKKGSWVLLGLAAGAVICSVYFRGNIRLGGGLPFIALNISRRIIMGRLTAQKLTN